MVLNAVGLLEALQQAGLESCFRKVTLGSWRESSGVCVCV